MVLFIVLGKVCNLKCEYCHQHFGKKLETIVSPKVYEIVEKERPEAIVFYGGEPLLYWDSIVEIVRNVSYNPRFCVITNGTLLDDDKVEFLNKHNFSVTLSWDGDRSAISRGIDVMTVKKDVIFKIDKLTINGVITSRNSPMEFINSIRPYETEYHELTGKYFGFHAEIIMDDGSNYSELADFDEEKIIKEMDEICKRYENIYFGGEHDEIIEIMVNMLRTRHNKYSDNSARCLVGDTRFAINLKGEAALCQGDDVILGEFDKEKVAQKIKAMDAFPARYKENCAVCPVREFCGNGCQLYAPTQMETFCKVRKMIYQPVVNMQERINNRLKDMGFDERWDIIVCSSMLK